MGALSSAFSYSDVDLPDNSTAKRSKAEHSADLTSASAVLALAAGLPQLGQPLSEILVRILVCLGPVHCSTVLVLVNKHWQQVSAHPELYTDLSQLGKASWLRSCKNSRQLIARLREPRCKLVAALAIPKLDLGSSTIRKLLELAGTSSISTFTMRVI
jgi:hypothetical protein